MTPELKDFMPRHTVKAKEVPIGMTFYTDEDEYIHAIPTGEMVMKEGLHFSYTELPLDSDEPLDPEQDMYVSKPELCGVAAAPKKLEIECATGRDGMSILLEDNGELLVSIRDRYNGTLAWVGIGSDEEQRLRDFLNART